MISAYTLVMWHSPSIKLLLWRHETTYTMQYSLNAIYRKICSPVGIAVNIIVGTFHPSEWIESDVLQSILSVVMATSQGAALSVHSDNHVHHPVAQFVHGGMNTAWLL